MADGDIQQSEFDSPHGLVEFNSCIYIADTNNHAIRVVRRQKNNRSKNLINCKFSSIQIHDVYLH
jgi:hypothetical protein